MVVSFQCLKTLVVLEFLAFNRYLPLLSAGVAGVLRKSVRTSLVEKNLEKVDYYTPTTRVPE